MQSANKRSLAILFFTMFIVMVGFGIIMPILPFYAESLGATATHLGLLFVSYSVVQFFFAPGGRPYFREPGLSMALCFRGHAILLDLSIIDLPFSSKSAGSLRSGRSISSLLQREPDHRDPKLIYY